MNDDVIPPSEVPPARKPFIETLSNLTTEELLKLQEDARNNPLLQALLNDKIRELKPSPVHRSNAIAKRFAQPYYKEEYAIELKPILDRMMQDGKDKEFRYSLYRRMRPSTLHARIRQSIHYLQDHLDPLNVYTLFRRKYEIVQARNGVQLVRVDTGDEKLQSDDLKYESTFREVFDAVKMFVEDAPAPSKVVFPDNDTVLYFELTEGERAEIDAYCSAVAFVTALVSNKEIKIIKQLVGEA